MSRRVLIRYRDFWDVPRVFLAEHRGRLFLFDCPFNEESEDFADEYRVSLLTAPTEKELAGSWETLPERAERSLGTVPISRVDFDTTRRKDVAAELLDELLAPESAINRAPSFPTP